MLFAFLLLLAASTRGEIADEVCRIPAGRWRYVPVELRQAPARISASYEVEDGSARVRLALMQSEDLERLRDELPHGHIAATPPGRRGLLADRFDRRGDYVVVVDNREGSREATVHLRVWVDFGAGRGPEVTGLSPGRQLTVVALSLAVFAGIVTYSSRRLWRAVKR
jgi:hypothetical protein